MFRFAAPWILLLVPVVLVAAWALARRRKQGDARLVLPEAGLRMRMARSPWQGLEQAMPWLRGIVLVLLVVCLARPQSGARVENVSTFGVDIVVALDISGSMRAEDFQPDNRLEVAKRTVEEFVEGRPSDRLGLVVFGSLAATRSPLTLDHEMLRQFLEQVDFAPSDQEGTAIGLGLATALNRLRESEARSKVVVLVTDGRNNSGQIGPKAASEAARALGVRVYTIGVGSDGEVPIPVGPLGRRYVRIELDEDLLKEIADSTGGRYFRATDAEGLRDVFATIDDLEKSEIESKVRVVYSEIFPRLLVPALALLLLERLLLSTRLRRLP
jgi:Ca-activated chloride channel family protein